MLDDDSRTTATGFFNYANSYWRAAASLQGTKLGTTHPSEPIAFLLHHSIELYLKSYLRAHGYSVYKLRTQFNHGIEKLHDQVTKNGLQLDDETSEVLRFWLTRQRFLDTRYPRTGYFVRVVTNQQLADTCNELHQAIGQALRDLGLPIRIR